MPPPPQRNFGRHIVIALSVSPSVSPSSCSVHVSEVGIPNLVCGCILGWWIVAYHFIVTVTLTSDLDFLEYSCPEHISYIIWGRNPKLVCACILGWQSVAYHPWVTLTLTSDLVCRIDIESGAYLLYSLILEFQIWCVDASWNDRVSHTIFGSLWHWPWPLTYLLESSCPEHISCIIWDRNLKFGVWVHLLMA